MHSLLAVARVTHPGGAEIGLLRLLPRLRHAGWDVHLVGRPIEPRKGVLVHAAHRIRALGPRVVLMGDHPYTRDKEYLGQVRSSRSGGRPRGAGRHGRRGARAPRRVGAAGRERARRWHADAYAERVVGLIVAP
jgi:hypothetical protein